MLSLNKISEQFVLAKKAMRKKVKKARPRLGQIKLLTHRTLEVMLIDSINTKLNRYFNGILNRIVSQAFPMPIPVRNKQQTKRLRKNGKGINGNLIDY